MKYLILALMTVLSACGSSPDPIPTAEPNVINPTTNNPSTPDAQPVSASPEPSPTPTPSPSPTVTYIVHPCAIEDVNWTTSNGGCHSVILNKTVSSVSSVIHHGLATSYCKSLNESGYTDWRLPTYLELQNLLQINNGNFDTKNNNQFLVLNSNSVENVVQYVNNTAVNSVGSFGDAPTICIR